MSASQVLNATA